MHDKFMSLYNKTIENYQIPCRLDENLLEEYIQLFCELSSTTFEVSEEISNTLFASSLYTLFWGVFSLSILSNEEEDNPSQTVISALSSSITNNLTSIIELSKKGLDFSAQILLRNLFEASHLFAVVLANPQKRQKYFDSAKEENTFKIWKKHFSMKELKKEIVEIEKKVLGNNSHDYFQIVNKWRKEKYSYYSNHVHNDFFHTFYNTFTEADNENDTMSPNLWGISGATRIDDLLGNLNDISFWISAFSTRIIFHDNLIDKNKLVSNKELANDANIFYLMALSQYKLSKQYPDF